MAPSQQNPGDVGEIMCLLQTIKDQIERQTQDKADSASTQTPTKPTIQTSKKYGLTNLSDHAQAVVGDVYFCDRDPAEQRLILQEFKQQMESFYQRQDKRDENLQRALCLITEINHGIRSKGSTTNSSPHMLSGQQLLSMIVPSDRERSPEQTLALCQSIAQRRQSKLTFVKPAVYMSVINQWLNASGSMLLHFTAKSSAEDHIVDIIVQLAAMLKDSGNLTIWSLPVGSDHNNIQMMLYDIVSQLVRFQPDITIETASLFSSTMLEEPLRIDAWIELLHAVLATVQKAFIVLNLSKQSVDTDQVDDLCSRMIAILADLVKCADAEGNVVKVLVYTSSITAIDTQVMENLEQCITCAVDAVPTNIALARRSSAQARLLTRQSLLAPVLSID